MFKGKIKQVYLVFDADEAGVRATEAVYSTPSVRGIEKRPIVDDDVNRDRFVVRLGQLSLELKNTGVCMGVDEQLCPSACAKR